MFKFISLELILTIIFGILTVILYIRQKRKRMLFYIQEDYFSIFNTIVRNLDKVEIKYDEKQITETLYLLKGCIINSGDYDITSTDITRPLALIFPKSCEIKDVNIDLHSDDLDIKVKFTKSSIQFNWSHFSKNEYFKFRIIIQQEKEIEDIQSSIKFHHKIRDLSSIKSYSANSLTKKIQRIESKFFPFLCFLFILLITIFIPQNYLDFVRDNQTLGVIILILGVIILMLPFLFLSKIYNKRMVKRYRIDY